MMWIIGRGTPPSFQAEGDRFCWPLLFRHSRHASTQKNAETPGPGFKARTLKFLSFGVCECFRHSPKLGFVSGHDFSRAIRGLNRLGFKAPEGLVSCEGKRLSEPSAFADAARTMPLGKKYLPTKTGVMT